MGQHIGYSCSAQRKTIKDVEVVLHSAKQKVINAVLHSASCKAITVVLHSAKQKVINAVLHSAS